MEIYSVDSTGSREKQKKISSKILPMEAQYWASVRVSADSEANCSSINLNT